MHETQRTISDWAVATFGDSKNPHVPVERMLKECNELKLKLEQPAISYEELADEIADVMICAYRAMDALGFSLHACVDHKMEINRARKWILHGDGTGQHVEGT